MYYLTVYMFHLFQQSEEEIRLLRRQRELEEEYNTPFLDMSLHRMIYKLTVDNRHKWAEQLRKEFKVPDRRFVHHILSVFFSSSFDVHVFVNWIASCYALVGHFLLNYFRNKPGNFTCPYDVRRTIFVCHKSSNKMYEFCMFPRFINLVPVDLKIGTHIDWTYAMYLTKNTTIKIT